ncbi:MAG: transporter substrate-binding domain-containing protein [Nitrospirota bacterium]|nr:MAG: transporter substrate-binding domain-containing protein [Nitrospirota bacterium]
MKKPRIPQCLTAVIFLGLFLPGFFQTINVAAATEPQQIQPGTLDSVLKNGTLRVGVSLFTPWVLKNKKGVLVGFEIDVANQLAKDLGVQLNLKEFDWDAMVPALLNKEIDIIVAGMVITPQRALKVNFSQPYANSGIGLATNLALTKDFTGLGDINRQQVKVGVVTGTIAEEVAKRLFPKATIQSFVKSEEAVQALVLGQLHGYVEHDPMPTYLALEHPGKIDEPLSEPLLSTKAGFAVNKGDPDFINFLNAWIIARDADSWLTSAHNYWFETLQWREEDTRAE